MSLILTPDDVALVLKYQPTIDYDNDLSGPDWHCGVDRWPDGRNAAEWPMFCSHGEDPNLALANWLIAVRKWQRHREHLFPMRVAGCALCDSLKFEEVADGA